MAIPPTLMIQKGMSIPALGTTTPKNVRPRVKRVCDLHDRSPPHDMVLVMKYLISLADRKMTLLEYAEKTSFLKSYFEDTLNPDLPLAAMTTTCRSSTEIIG
jgi:hypothetical protein